MDYCMDWLKHTSSVVHDGNKISVSEYGEEFQIKRRGRQQQECCSSHQAVTSKSKKQDERARGGIAERFSTTVVAFLVSLLSFIIYPIMLLKCFLIETKPGTKQKEKKEMLAVTFTVKYMEFGYLLTRLMDLMLFVMSLSEICQKELMLFYHHYEFFSDLI